MRVKRTSSFTKTLQNEESTRSQSPKKQEPLLQSQVKSIVGTLQSTRDQTRVKQHSMAATAPNHAWTATKAPEKPKQSIKQSRMGSAIRTKLKSVANPFQHVKNCEICDEEIQRGKDIKDVYIAKCEHQNNYCEACLLRYVIYRVRINQEVTCPHEGCPAKMIDNSQFFKKLPIDVQMNYRYMLQLLQKSKTKHLKVCPNDGCNGILRPSYKRVFTCNTCSNAFCTDCVLPVHNGHCNNYDPRFFEVAQRYQTCKWCKLPVKKEEGSIHMKCRCGCEFCYVCGKKWSSIHERGHQPNGQVKMNAFNILTKDDSESDNSCSPLKVLIIVVCLPLIFTLYLLRDIVILAGVLLMTLVVGIFAFSFEFITRVDGFLCIVLVVFLPVTMLIGVVIAFSEIFCPMMKQYIGLSCRETCERASQIWRA